MTCRVAANCGPLVRREDGSWWYEDTCLGRDNEPKYPAYALASSLAIVCLRLSAGLEAAALRLRSHGEAAEVDRLLAQYERWRLWRTWPRLLDEVAPILRDAERKELVQNAMGLFERLFVLLRDDDLASVLTEAEAWLEQASRTYPQTSKKDPRRDGRDSE